MSDITFRILFFLSLTFSLLFSSCGKDSHEPSDVSDNVDYSKIKRTVFVYAVNHSSLSYDFNDDLKEMREAFASTDENLFQLLLFKTDSKEKCGLYRMEKDKSGTVTLALVKSYVRDKTSTSPNRIAEVVNDALGLFPNSVYDMIFWGHATSWLPDFSDHQITPDGMQKSYGGEYNGAVSSSGYRYTDWVNINELADCLPDKRIQTIWFDCCYMSGIEVIYEFRNKCDFFVAYPTEVWAEGMPYDKVLPKLLKTDPDLIGAARTFFDFYDNRGSQATVAVVDMKGLENLATVSHDIISSAVSLPDKKGLLNYSRISKRPLFDFRQFIHSVATCNGADEKIADFDKAFYETIIYSANTANDFNNRPWTLSVPSGVSTHYFTDNNTSDNNFYKTLDWYNRIYK